MSYNDDLVYISKTLREMDKVDEKFDLSNQEKLVNSLHDIEGALLKHIFKIKKLQKAYVSIFKKNAFARNKHLIYFRESRTKVDEALEDSLNENYTKLEKLPINLNAALALKEEITKLGLKDIKLDNFIEKIRNIRESLIVQNIPLAFNKAVVFSHKVPAKDMGQNDMFNHCVIGLCRGIDKYKGRYTPVWRSVCIGYMTKELLDSYNKVLIQVPSMVKELAYKINTVLVNGQYENIEVLTIAVNEAMSSNGKTAKKITSDKVVELIRLYGHGMSISQSKDGDAVSGSGENTSSVVEKQLSDHSPIDGGSKSYRIDDRWRESYDIDNDLEKHIEDLDTSIQLRKSIQGLPLIERKILRLKGVR